MDSSESIVDKRKERVLSFLKSRTNWIVYALLALVVFIAVKIRTANIPGLRDVTTNDFTLGPDLDPFLFLRYAKTIVMEGSLPLVDMMRSVPLGSPTSGDFLLHPYLIAFFHKFIAPLFGTTSVTHSAVIYPVFMFALTVIAFFFLTRELFVGNLGNKKASIIALISTFFLSTIPVFIPRTIAGIPEKEAAAFFFMFSAFYFFIKAWNSRSYIFAGLAAFFTVSMAFIWGGYAYIFLIIAPSVFIAFILGNIDKKRCKIYSLWIILSVGIMSLFPEQYTLKALVTSTSIYPALSLLIIFIVHYLVFEKKEGERSKLFAKWKLPPQINSIILSLLVLIIVTSILFGISFIPNQFADIYHNLVKPATSRLIQTVAENKQPYFDEWASSFGPQIRSIPISFWLVFVGSIYFFNSLVRRVFNKKESLILSGTYTLFIISLIFSRYRSNSIFNGENLPSILLYALGALVFLFTIGYYYFSYYKKNEFSKFKEINFEYIFVFIFFFLAIISARGLIRLVMILVPPAAIILGFFSLAAIYSLKNRVYSRKYDLKGLFAIIIILLVIFSGYSFYRLSRNVAESYIPSGYTQQWQRAMGWVRESTPTDAVFGHWWDYGYWVQSMGERATVLDGGNLISYWNHFMGRYALTGPSEREALEFLYPHNVTHFLIDSTDIGKYGAFSAIGSDENYDRQSWIPAMSRDNAQTAERKNSTLYVYSGGSIIDQDIYYNLEGQEIFLPGGKAALGAVVIEMEKNGSVISSKGVFVYQNNQYTIPLRYTYDNELIDFGKGIDAGVFLMPRLITEGEGGYVEERGGLLYLSPRVVHSQLARKYLYGEQTPAYRLAYTQSDPLIENLRSQNINVGEFLMYGGFRGPIRIWEINYPSDIEFKEEYLETSYPEQIYKA